MRTTVQRAKEDGALQMLSVVQTLGDQRARIDPSAVPSIACWIIALRQRYEAQARLTLSGTTGRARKLRQGRIAWAQTICEALDVIARSLHETIDLRAYDVAMREFETATAGYSEEE